MALASYADLLASAASWLNRDDLTAVIPDLVVLAEADFGRRLRLRLQIKRATAVLDEEYEALPPDWIEAVSLTVSASPVVVLEYVTPQQMATLKAGGEAGTPAYYTIKGGEFQFYPTPSGSPTLEMTYYAKVPPLAEDGTNALFAAAPDLYLWGTLMQSAPFLREDERIITWGALYKAAMDGLMASDARAAQSGSALAIRPTSYVP
ncbi:phage adaptor protein [Azospirillum picis]|uniref:Uncharacterized protein n=1 Tax=Azospirillum picis TaxID=488438 RepID=A0ABU0MPK3_9PROT|nr:hypothetical protein [Azospirillum picis]MBP2301571.1 hypothetical protein [Azospirillum picis]MDQ0535403.1 hypothetical protein [Azospirillum picis]